MERIADESQNNLFGMNHTSVKNKHHLRQSVNKRHHQNVDKFLTTLKSNINPFTYEENNLVCLSSAIVFSKDIQNHVDKIGEIGQTSYENFVKNRIVVGSEGSIWDPVKKNNLQLCKTKLKKLKIGGKATTLEIKEDRSLFTRILIATRMRPEIDLKKIICNYELASVPRSMFNSHGELHFCSKKSELLGLLEKYSSENDEVSNSPDNFSEGVHVAVVDAMADLQGLSTDNLTTCGDLATKFCNKLFDKYKDYTELYILYLIHTIKSLLKT